MGSDRLTPVMQLAISEGLLEVPNPATLAKRLSRGLLKDISDQADYTLLSWPYEDLGGRARTDAFRVTLATSIDPFEAQGKCRDPRCRISMAERFARSVALYVDQAIVPDPITATLTSGYRTVGALSHALYSDLQVLRTLLPLIEDDVVRFGTPVRAVCAQHQHESERITEEGVKYAEQLLTDAGLHTEIDLRRDGKGARLSIVCPKMFGTGSHEIGTFLLSKKRANRWKPYWKRKNGDSFLTENDSKEMRHYIRSCVLSLLGSVTFKLATASGSGSTFATGSRLEAAVLSYLDGRQPYSKDIADYEGLRSVELPWIRHLSPAQIVQLRQEASPALSQFRASFAERLNPKGEGGSVEKLVSELRSQAVEVENELAAYRTAGGRRTDLALGRAALAFVVYGVMAGAGTAATAIATALTVRATLHQSKKQERIETERLKARAPYLLVHAKELLTHRA